MRLFSAHSDLASIRDCPGCRLSCSPGVRGNNRWKPSPSFPERQLQPPSCLLDSQDQQPVALLAIVAIGLPGLDLQPLRVRALRAVQRFQQARRAQVHRVEGTQLHAEDLAVLPMVLRLQPAAPSQRASLAVPGALLPPPGAAATATLERTVRPGRPPRRGFGAQGREGRGNWGATRHLPACRAVS